MADLFWCSDEQWVWIAPLLPKAIRRMPNVDNRRLVSESVHVLKSGGRSGDWPEHIYAPTRCATTASGAWLNAVYGNGSSLS